MNKFILQDCCANIIIVEEEKGVNKILAMKNELPDLKKIVQVIFNAVINGYHLSITKFIASSPNFLLNYHQQYLFWVYLFITKLNAKSPI